jgi:hypothetical protein
MGGDPYRTERLAEGRVVRNERAVALAPGLTHLADDRVEQADESLHPAPEAGRTVHDLSVSFADHGAYDWHPLATCRPVCDLEIIGSGDLAPWNMVFEGTEVTGIIGWDAAGPRTRSWDMAYLSGVT